MSRAGRKSVARWRRIVDFATREIWLIEPEGASRLRAAALRVSRVLLLAANGVQRHRTVVQAAALTYYTVLSVVPVLAVSFALARGLGAYDELKNDTLVPFLNRYLGHAAQSSPVEGAAGPSGPTLEPTGVPPPATEGAAQLRGAVDQLLSLVDRTSDVPLGMFGVAVLLYTAVKLLSAVERSLNDIWGLERGRTWTRRFTDYIAIVVVTPILLIIGTAATTAVRTLRLRSFWGDHEVDLSRFMAFVLQAAPLAVIWLGLTFAYLALPNTHVRRRPAAIGGAAAALLWLVSQFLYVELQVGIAKYNALYAGFAALPIFLFWVYLSWTIFLLGAELTYALQNVPLFTSIARTGVVDHAFRESLALRLAGRIAGRFSVGEEPPSAVELAAEMHVAPRAVNQVLASLVERGILIQAGEPHGDRFVPARSPELITVAEILAALKREKGSQRLIARARVDERVDRILEGLEGEARASLHNYTLRELALAAREPEIEVAERSAGAAPQEPRSQEATG